MQETRECKCTLWLKLSTVIPPPPCENFTAKSFSPVPLLPFPKEAYISYGYGYAFFLSFSPLFPFFSSFIYFFFSPLPQWWNTLRSIKPVKPTQSRCNTTGRARYSQHVISDSLLRKIKRVEVKRDPLKCLEILITIRVNLLRDKTHWVWEMETGLHFEMYLFCLIFWNVFSDININ